MDIAKGFVVLCFGVIPAYLIFSFTGIPDMALIFSILYLAAVIAATSSGSNKKG